MGKPSHEKENRGSSTMPDRPGAQAVSGQGWLAEQCRGTAERMARIDRLDDRYEHAKSAGDEWVKVRVDELGSALILLGLLRGARR